MIFTVSIESLLASAVIGFYEHESTRETKLSFDVVVRVDVNDDANLDILSNVVDYDSICSTVLSVVHGGEFKSLERLVAEVVRCIANIDKRIVYCKVSVHKRFLKQNVGGIVVSLEWNN